VGADGGQEHLQARPALFFRQVLQLIDDDDVDAVECHPAGHEPGQLFRNHHGDLELPARDRLVVLGIVAGTRQDVPLVGVRRALDELFPLVDCLVDQRLGGQQDDGPAVALVRPGDRMAYRDPADPALAAGRRPQHEHGLLVRDAPPQLRQRVGHQRRVAVLVDAQCALFLRRVLAPLFLEMLRVAAYALGELRRQQLVEHVGVVSCARVHVLAQRVVEGPRHEAQGGGGVSRVRLGPGKAVPPDPVLHDPGSRFPLDALGIDRMMPSRGGPLPVTVVLECPVPGQDDFLGVSSRGGIGDGILERAAVLGKHVDDVLQRVQDDLAH